MEKCQIVHKQIELTKSEIDAAAEEGKKNKTFVKMPQPVLEFVIKRVLTKMRGSSLEIKLPEVKITNTIEKSELTVDVGAGKVGVYFYKRENLPEKKYPLFYFIHGGGFLGGTYLANEGLLKKIADNYNVVCASVEYHVSPEVHFPVALQECEAGLLSLLKATNTAGFIDEKSVFIAGDSAGGNLAAAVCLSLKQSKSLIPAGQILLYPVTDMLNFDKGSYRRREVEFRGMFKMMKFSRKMYAKTKKDYRNVLFSPLLSTAQDDPAPTKALLLIAGRDGLREDGLCYAKHLTELGGEARAVVYDNSFHAFINGLGDSLAAEDAYHEIVDFIQASAVAVTRKPK
jgi:acetyl esterase